MQQTRIHLTCSHCLTVNRLAAERLEQRPACGQCHLPLFNGAPIELDRNNFSRHFERSELPLLVDFWAPWCGPCRSMAPAFQAAAAQLEPYMRLAKLDTEAEPALAQRFNIRSIPTLALFRQGREVMRQSGALPLPQLLAWARHAAAA